MDMDGILSGWLLHPGRNSIEFRKAASSTDNFAIKTVTVNWRESPPGG
jgi:hypothetical protein